MLSGNVEDDGLMVIDKVYETGEMSTMELRNLVFTFYDHDHFIITIYCFDFI